MLDSLETKVTSKGTIKGHLDIYRFCDNVSCGVGGVPGERSGAGASPGELCCPWWADGALVFLPTLTAAAADTFPLPSSPCAGLVLHPIRRDLPADAHAGGGAARRARGARRPSENRGGGPKAGAAARWRRRRRRRRRWLNVPAAAPAAAAGWSRWELCSGVRAAQNVYYRATGSSGRAGRLPPPIRLLRVPVIVTLGVQLGKKNKSI